MQPLRPRPTVRHLMLLVGITAVLCGGYVWHRAAQRFRIKAANHRSEALSFDYLTKLSKEGQTEIQVRQAIDGTPEEWVITNRLATRPAKAAAAEAFDRRSREIATKCRSMACYHEGLRRKWARAASYPWWSVSPDPPPPLPLKRESEWGDSSF